MDLRATEGVASRFVEYVEHLSEVIGHMDRHGLLASYCSGLLLPGERKSIEPMAARLAPDDGLLVAMRQGDYTYLFSE